MPLIDPTDPRPVHFVGIAGAGMCALAELFARRGVAVTGCDASLDGRVAADLAALGIAAVSGHSASHIPGARALVVTSALPADHPERMRAAELGLPVIRRAEALGEAVSGGELVAIAGTHGKTTTTVMTTEALRAAGLEPTGVAGGRVGAEALDHPRDLVATGRGVVREPRGVAARVAELRDEVRLAEVARHPRRPLRVAELADQRVVGVGRGHREREPRDLLRRRPVPACVDALVQDQPRDGEPALAQRLRLDDGEPGHAAKLPSSPWPPSRI
jgi:hypothetical protein